MFWFRDYNRCMQNPNTNILDTLRENLRSVSPSQWERIAAECGVARTLPRKIVYNDRKNPGVNTIQPLITFFEKQAAVNNG